MSPLFYVIVSVGVLVAIFLIGLLTVVAFERVAEWRDKQARRVRNSRSKWDLVKSYEPSARERRL